MLKQNNGQSPVPARKNQKGFLALKVTANKNSSKFGAGEEHEVKRYTEVSDKCNHGIPF
jgi:hypothetical protein